MTRPQPHVAFMAAALVLLVLPLLAVAALSAFSVVTWSVMDSDAVGLLLAASIVWMLLVAVVVLALVAQIRRGTRS